MGNPDIVPSLVQSMVTSVENRFILRIFTHAGHRIVDIQRIAGPVHLHSIPCLVLGPHGCLGNPGPLPVLLAELCVHIQRCAVIFAAIAVFRSQQS